MIEAERNVSSAYAIGNHRAKDPGQGIRITYFNLKELRLASGGQGRKGVKHHLVWTRSLRTQEGPDCEGQRKAG